MRRATPIGEVPWPEPAGEDDRFRIVPWREGGCGAAGGTSQPVVRVTTAAALGLTAEAFERLEAGVVI